MFDITSFLLGLQKGKSMGGSGSGGGATETDIIPLQDATFTQNTQGIYEWYLTPAPAALKAGETYHVKWGEQEYTLTAVDASAILSGGVALGNLGIYGMADTGEPFLFAYVPNYGGTGVATLGCLTLETDAIRSVRVYQKARSDSGLVRYVTFIGALGNTLFEMPVLAGDDCKDPINHGDIETPTKESTVSEVFTYSGWALTADGTADSSALENVTEDRTVYAAFAVSARKYTVNFYDGDTLVETVQAEYGTTANPTYEKDGYILVAWKPSNVNITQDTDCYGEWVIDDGYIHDDWDVISARCEEGTATDYYELGDKITVPIAFDSGTTEIDFEIVDTSNFISGTTLAFLATVALDEPIVFDENDLQYYSGSTLASYLDSDIQPRLPEKLKSVMKKVSLPYASESNHLHIPTSQMLLGKKYGDTFPSQNNYLDAFYNTGKSLIRRKADGTAVSYWLASTYSTTTMTYYQYIKTTGSLDYCNRNTSNTHHIVLLFFV